MSRVPYSLQKGIVGARPEERHAAGRVYFLDHHMMTATPMRQSPAPKASGLSGADPADFQSHKLHLTIERGEPASMSYQCQCRWCRSEVWG